MKILSTCQKCSEPMRLKGRDGTVATFVCTSCGDEQVYNVEFKDSSGIRPASPCVHCGSSKQ